MKKPFLTLALFLYLLWLESPAFAWSGAGHMVIAAGAYQNLSRSLKKKVTAILKSHPDYDKWEKSFTGESPNLDLAAFIFMRASTWPDEIRRGHQEFDHPQWHYIDYPLRPPAFPMEPGPAPTNDVLFGISQCEKIMPDRHAAPELRAVYLSWLVHLVGDMHQPLHCCSLFNDTYPHGDKGGNDFYVMPGSRGIKLHSLWDGLLGNSGKAGAHWNYAVQIESEHPKKSLPELKKDKTPQAWSLEGRALAVEKAYLRGTLKGSTNPDDAPALPEDYTKTVKIIAESQAALAGYRLADEIKKFVR